MLLRPFQDTVIGFKEAAQCSSLIRDRDITPLGACSETVQNRCVNGTKIVRAAFSLLAFSSFNSPQIIIES